MELKYKEFSSEAARLQELSEENDTLRRQLNELQLPSDVDGKIPRKPLESLPSSSLVSIFRVAIRKDYFIYFASQLSLM